MDEPTTGLHFADVKVLMDVLNRIVDKGNTVILVEHNLDVIIHSDYIIDLGPDGGDKGGELVACGPPRKSHYAHTPTQGIISDSHCMKIRNVLFLILIALSLLNSIYAQEGLSTLMLEGLAEMDASLLREKSEYLGLASDGSAEEILQRLYSHYGFTETTDEQTRNALDPKEKSVVLESAHYYYMNSDGNSIILSGNVSLTGPSWALTADIVLYDVKKQVLTAVGTVLFTQEEREVSSASITFSVNERDLTILNGEILFDRTTSENEPLSLLSKGERMRFIQNPAAYSASEASVTSSIEHSYYQIDAQEALFVTGNDVFITDATLLMGRVPILYLPFFFYPGKSLIFNPLFGFDSMKGSFMTLSYELYGQEPPAQHRGKEGGPSPPFLPMTGFSPVSRAQSPMSIQMFRYPHFRSGRQTAAHTFLCTLMPTRSMVCIWASIHTLPLMIRRSLQT